MAPSFLNLEQSKRLCVTIDTIVNDKGTHTSTESILTEITDFYAMLYSCQDSQTEDGIKDFLDSIPSLPKISCDTSLLTMSISQEEVAEAVKSLRPGKASGCDGLTSEFYKYFEELLVPILTSLFASIWEAKCLMDTQSMAIIILLFKKGDQRYLANYRLISLTNADYMILAYVLSHWLSEHLSDVIAVNQTAYMAGHFIGTNIQFVQDTMSHFILNSPNSIVLFLDYTKSL